MSTKQQWKLDGRWLTHEQVLERRKKLEKPVEEKPVKEVAPEEAAEERELTFFELKALAKEKGMEVDSKTKKKEVLAFLESNK